MKIQYFMYVNWFWIFQRPQIFALLLEKDYDVTVYSKKVLFKKLVAKNNKIPKKLKFILQLPKEDWFPVVKTINRVLTKMAFSKCDKYDILWISHPYQVDYIPKKFKGKIVYDCMDNYVPLARKEEREEILEKEKILINRSDIIFTSSEYIQNNVIKNKKSHLVRNGFVNERIIEPFVTKRKNEYVIGYFGTISEWFDIELVVESRNRFRNVQYVLIGPSDRDECVIGGIEYKGVVQHDKLIEHVKSMDALFMPFIINDIILAVDPVKLYEYICFGKCIISIWYPEIERFDPFVYFYKSHEEYYELIEILCEKGFPPKYNRNQQAIFLEENSWDNRYEIVKKVLQDK